MKELFEPFPASVVEWRPGATTKDKTRAIALGYVDMREYENRADSVLGTGGWTLAIELLEISDRIVFKSVLTVGDVVRHQVGEKLLVDKKGIPDPNAATGAYAQAVKRVWASFGMGRYLYSLPVWWADYNHSRHCFTDEAQAELQRKYSAWLKGQNEVVTPLTATIGKLGQNIGKFSNVEDALGKTLQDMDNRELRLVYSYAANGCTQEAENILIFAFNLAKDWKEASSMYEAKYSEEK